MHFLLLHGTGGGPEECWYPWLTQILRKKGHEVIAPRLPTPVGQTLENWLEVFEPNWKCFDENLVIIGRSIGVPFALRLLERSPAKIRAAFLVAGFYYNLHLPQFASVVDSFIEFPFQWEKIRKNCGKFYIYNADNDPIVPLEKGRELAAKLGVEIKLVTGGEHLWFETFPEILLDIENL